MMSGAGPEKTAEIAAKVESFVREIVVPYERDPRRDHHGAPTDELVFEMRELARGAGILTPHVLRHSFASHMLQSSGDLRAVQELLGHANITTTQVYTRLDFQHLARAYDAAHPRAKLKAGDKK